MFTSRCGPHGELATKSAMSVELSASRSGFARISVFHGLSALNGRHAVGAPTVTSTLAVAVAEGSATLVALMWQVAISPGAVYTPSFEIAPHPEASCSDQVTAVFVAPVTAEPNA